MLSILPGLAIGDDELEITAVRAAGPGGQHGDKASTAVQLRFDVRASSLPDRYKQRLLAMRDHRITREGVVVIKAQEHRSRERNEQSARERLAALVRCAGQVRRPRRVTRPGLAARRRRTDEKKRHGRRKALRKPPAED